MRKWTKEAPVSAVSIALFRRKTAAINSKWTPIKRDDQKFNGMFEMFASVTFLL